MKKGKEEWVGQVRRWWWPTQNLIHEQQSYPLSLSDIWHVLSTWFSVKLIFYFYDYIFVRNGEFEAEEEGSGEMSSTSTIEIGADRVTGVHVRLWDPLSFSFIFVKSNVPSDWPESAGLSYQFLTSFSTAPLQNLSNIFTFLQTRAHFTVFELDISKSRGFRKEDKELSTCMFISLQSFSYWWDMHIYLHMATSLI